MIPETIDVIALLNELNALGLKDSSVEVACNFNKGYVAQIRCGNSRRPNYQYMARLMNLAEAERLKTQGSTRNTENLSASL